MSLRPAQAIQRDPVSKNKNKNKKPQKPSCIKIVVTSERCEGLALYILINVTGDSITATGLWTLGPVSFANTIGSQGRKEII
jgi:hypothetical protein